MAGKHCRTDWQHVVLGLVVTHPVIQDMADAVQSFCAAWIRNKSEPRVLVIVGNPGCGKTRCAEKVFNWARGAVSKAVKTPQSVDFARWPRVVELLAKKEDGMFEDLQRSGLLLLDDIGAEQDRFRNHVGSLATLLNERERRFTLITTNIPTEKWAETWDVRVEDRLLRNSTVIDVREAPSFAKWKLAQ